jgi:hypothetical protein
LTALQPDESTLPHASERREWRDPLYDLLQTIGWIVTSGINEMQKYPLEVVYAAPVSVSTTAGQYATSIGNSRKLFQDKYGKYFAFWKDSNASPHTYLGYSNTNPPTSGWTANDLGVNFYLYANDPRFDPAAAYDSTNDRVMLAFSEATSANVGIAQITFSRDVNNNIIGYTASSVTTHSLTRACESPSAWMLHNGDVAVVYGNDDILGQVTENHVEFFRAVFGNPPSYRSAAGVASTVDTLYTYNTAYTDAYATVVERTNSGAGQYDLYAFWMMTRGSTLSVVSMQEKAVWSSPNWSWGASGTSTAAINGPPTANYDTMSGLVVYSSANKIAAGTQVNVGTISASDSGSDISATGLTSDTRTSPTISIDQTTGNYYIFYERTDQNLYYIERTGGAWISETSFTSTANENYPTAKVDGAGNRIELIWTHYTGSAYNVYYGYISTLVTQPITLTVSPAGAPTGTFTLSGCAVSPSTVIGDGSSHSVTAMPSCSLTVTVPTDGSNTRYRFSAGATFWSLRTCASGTCSAQSNTYYYQTQNTYQATPLAQTTWDSGLNTITITGTVAGSSGQTICSMTPVSGGGTVSCSGWGDSNAPASFPSSVSGAPTNSRWQGTGTFSFTDTTGGNTHTVNYYKQWYNTYKASPLAQTTWDAGLSTITITGTQFGSSGQIDCSITLTGGGGAATCSGYEDHNTAASVGSITGAPTGSRWQISGTSSFTETSGGNTHNVNYYKQWDFKLSYSVSGGGSPTAPTFTSTQFGSAYTPTLTGSSTDYWLDANAAWSIINPLSPSGSSERWQTNQVVTGTVSSAQTIAFNYFHQYQNSFAYSVAGGGPPTAPTLTCTQYGGFTNCGTLGTTMAPIWVDSGGSYSATNPAGGSTGSERWDSNAPSGTVSSGGVQITITYYHQYQQTLSYSVSGGASGYSAPTFSSMQFGSSSPQVLTNTPTGYWFDNGGSWTVTNPLGGSSGSEQWATSQSTSGTIASAQTIAFAYQHQYYLTMSSSPSLGGSVSPASGWQNSGAVIASISATPSGGYAFNGWSGTGTTSYTGPNNPCSNCVTMNGAVSETANFLVALVTANNRTLSVSSGGANMTAPQTVNPTTEYWFGTGISDTASMTDINSVTIDLYRTGHAPGTFSNSFVYSFRWVANGWSGTPSCSTSPGCWQELQSSGWVASSFNYLVSSDSSVTTIGGSAASANWRFAVKLDQLAVYTTNGAGLWNFKATVASKSGGVPSGTRAGTFDVNLLVSITVPGNMDWGTVAAGSVNTTATGMPVYTTYTANAIVTITVYGGGNPIDQYGDSFPLSYVYIGKTSSPANNDGVVLSTSPTIIYSSLPVAANSNLVMYWFISTPNPFTPGTYTLTYSETIQLQSMQS